jgi:hypothetical protein
MRYSRLLRIEVNDGEAVMGAVHSAWMLYMADRPGNGDHGGDRDRRA